MGSEVGLSNPYCRYRDEQNNCAHGYEPHFRYICAMQAQWLPPHVLASSFRALQRNVSDEEAEGRIPCG
jgi:hypothetical protein